ncbi:hypothetical protein GALL_236000 [mine drainage metagenome]|uniref:Uncharacterized protein n=1 Tax=mine drainage metagenome TaxID=410659 RepID=A0A1J5RQT9_9ZZZZ
MNYSHSFKNFLLLILMGVASLIIPSTGYCDVSQLAASLFEKKQESYKQNSARINLESSLLVKRLEGLRPSVIDANVHIVESFSDSGGFEERGDSARLGIDGGVIQIDGFAPDSKDISDFLAAIENDHIGKVELDLFKPEMLNGKSTYRFGIRVMVGAISSDTQTTAERFIPVTPEIYVFDTSQFKSYTGPNVSKLGAERLGLDDDSFNRRRIGSVQLSKNINVFVDELQLPNNIEYELVDVTSGEPIQKVYTGQFGASALRFTGAGTVYVTDKRACRSEATRKFVLQGRKLVEIQQPLLYVGIDSRVVGNVKIFLDTDGKTQIATLQSGTVVTVIGRASRNGSDTLLIKTPLGLTGWLIEGADHSGGNLMMDACG